jgi:titin
MDPISAVPMWVPSEPRDLQHDITPFKVHLDWEEPANFRGSSNVTYNVYMGPNLSSLKKASSEINVTQAVINTPDIGRATLFFVRAENEMGEGPRSETLNLTPMGDLSRPLNLTATELGNSILLQWKRPEFTGGAPTITYDLLTGPDEWNLSIYKLGIENTTFVMSGVTPGRTYYIGVRANNSYWHGPLSDIVFTTPYNPPTKVLELNGSIGDSYVNLTWREPLDLGGDLNVSYEIFMASGGGDLRVLRWLNNNRTMVRSLENGVSYIFAVRAYNIKGPGPFSNFVNLTPMTIPSPPRNLLYTEDGGSLNLTWEQPLSFGGAPSVSYTVLMGRSRDNLTPVENGLERTQYLLTGLVKGELYIISVTAVNIIGMSERSNTIEAVPMTVPSPPRELSFNWTEQGLRLRWKGPSDDGGGDIWYFHIYRGNDPANMTLIKSLGGSFFSYLDTEAEKGGTYFYRISCENSLGRSPYSDILTVEPEIVKKDEFDMRLVYIGIGAALILLAIVIGLLLLRNNRRKDWYLEE